MLFLASFYHMKLMVNIVIFVIDVCNHYFLEAPTATDTKYNISHATHSLFETNKVSFTKQNKFVKKQRITKNRPLIINTKQHSLRIYAKVCKRKTKHVTMFSQHTL